MFCKRVILPNSTVSRKVIAPLLSKNKSLVLLLWNLCLAVQSSLRCCFFVPAAVIVGFDRMINYYKIQYAQLCINENPGCEFIATNLDAVTHLTDAQVPR